MTSTESAPSVFVQDVTLRDGMHAIRHRYTVDECRKIAMRVLDAPRSLDVQRVLVNLKVD